MWLNRMLKDRQEILVLGELVLFLSAWGLCIAAAVDDYRVRSNDNADNNIAANVDPSSLGFSQPGLSQPDQSQPEQSHQPGLSDRRGELE